MFYGSFIINEYPAFNNNTMTGLVLNIDHPVRILTGIRVINYFPELKVKISDSDLATISPTCISR